MTGLARFGAKIQIVATLTNVCELWKTVFFFKIPEIVENDPLISSESQFINR